MKKKIIQNGLKKFLSSHPVKSFDQGELLLEIDQPLTIVACLDSGFVRQYSVSGDGVEFTQNIFKQGAIFPLNLAFQHEYNPYYFEALTDVTATVVPTDEMMTFLESNPEALMALTKRMASGLNQLLFRFESLVFGSAQQRLAAAIYLLAIRFGVSHEEAVKNGCVHKNLSQESLTIAAFPLTHQQLAYFTALTRETVSVEMMNLRKLGLIDYAQQKICLLKPSELKELSSLPFYY